MKETIKAQDLQPGMKISWLVKGKEDQGELKGTVREACLSGGYISTLVRSKGVTFYVSFHPDYCITLR